MPGFEILDQAERQEVLQVLESGVLMRYGFDPMRRGRWMARELEEALAARLGARHAHVCANGTSAVLTALAACGVGAGTEVIVPPFTFVADIEAVLWLGAIPVFADIDETLGLDPAAVERALTPRTRAVLVVHMCGSMARIDRLATLCAKHGVALVEDVAQAIGATFQGKPLGRFGRIGCFSFDFVKTITAGEGGAVITDDPQLYETVQAFTDHGHDHRGADRGADGHPILGFNFRISELHAAVGLAQLRKLDAILQRQRAVKQRLKQGLAELPGLLWRDLPDPEGDSATFLSWMMPTAEEARAAAARLKEAGVDGVFYWFENNWHYLRRWEHFHDLRSPAPLAVQQAGWLKDLRSVQLPQSDAIMSRTLSMLIKLGWSEADIDDRLRRMRRALG